MIQPLRTLHHRAVIALAFALPAIVVAGLGARRPVAPPPSHAMQLPSSAVVIRKSDTLWHKHVVETVFFADSRQPGEVEISLHPMQDLNEPDLLLYWCADQPQGDSLPTSAQLIGPFIADQPFVLPLRRVRAGYLVLFSLPHHSLIDSARVEALP